MNSKKVTLLIELSLIFMVFLSFLLIILNMVFGKNMLMIIYLFIICIILSIITILVFIIAIHLEVTSLNIR